MTYNVEYDFYRRSCRHYTLSCSIYNIIRGYWYYVFLNRIERSRTKVDFSYGLFFYFLFTSLSFLKAQAPISSDFGLQLSLSRSKVHVQDSLVMKLQFKNISTSPKILIEPPRNEQENQVVSFSFYKEIDHVKHLLEVVELPSTSINSKLRLVPAGESTHYSFFFNDTILEGKCAAFGYQLPDLPPGRYLVQATYLPFNSVYSAVHYQTFTGVSALDTLSIYTNKTAISMDGLRSNFSEIEIVSYHPITNLMPTGCSDKCGLCKAAEKGNWKVVENWIRWGTFSFNLLKKNRLNYIEKPHRSIYYLDDFVYSQRNDPKEIRTRHVIFKYGNQLKIFELHFRQGWENKSTLFMNRLWCRILNKPVLFSGRYPYFNYLNTMTFENRSVKLHWRWLEGKLKICM